MKQDEADAALQEITVSMQVMQIHIKSEGENRKKKAVFLSLVSVTAYVLYSFQPLQNLMHLQEFA